MGKTGITAPASHPARDASAILNDAEVVALSGKIRRLVGPIAGKSAAGAGLRVDDVVRWTAVRTRCEQVRGCRRLSIKDVAVALQLPQYRLRAIEAGRLHELKADMAQRYFSFLGMDGWITDWCIANQDLARRARLLEACAYENGRKKSVADVAARS